MRSLPLQKFAPTRWSLIARSRSEDPGLRQAAMEELCRAYWQPLYAYLRQLGRSVEDAQDTTQTFFAGLMNGGLLGRAEPGEGRFRTLLIKALRDLERNAARDAGRQKRGGGATVVPLEAAMAEECWEAQISSAGEDPAMAFDRVWGTVVVDRARNRLRREFESMGRLPVFEALSPRLTGAVRQEGRLAEVAAGLGMTEVAVKMALSRLRRHFGAAIRAEIAETVEDPGMVEEELRYLCGFSGGGVEKI